MARLAADDVLDNGLEAMDTAVEGGTGMMTVCAGTPTTYAHASKALGTDDGMVIAHLDNPTLTIAADVSGRKCTISEALAVPIALSGTATHIALTDGSAKLWFVTTCTSQALVAGGTVDIPAWKINILAPTAP